VAKRLLPAGCINRLILATNENDILTRFVNQGDYSIIGEVTPTSSPSMDIQIASNFERYLYYLRGEDGSRVKADMEAFAETGRMDLSGLKEQVARDFASVSVSEDETITAIGEFYKDQNYLLDPHTAVGIRAGRELKEDRPMVCLATAHPAKFGGAVQKATGKEVDLPPALAKLAGKESRCEVLDADVELIRDYVSKHALS